MTKSALTAASFAAAAASALLLAFAMPGLTGCWPLLSVALVPLLWAVRNLSPMKSACVGLTCGVIHHLVLLYWIVIVLKNYGGLHVLLASGALLLLALYMSLYTGLFCLLLNLAASFPNNAGSLRRSPTVMLLAAPTFWVGLDVLRGHLLTGMPWMDLGYGLCQQPLLIQAADLGGHNLLTFCIVQINALVFWLADRRFSRFDKEPKRHYLYAIAIGMALYGIGGYSVIRYRQVLSAAASAVRVSVTVVQGNINQGMKWSPAMKTETVDRYIALSHRSSRNGEKPDLVVWPETALPFFPSRDPLMNRVREFIRQERLHLLTGSPYFTVDPERSKPIEYFNSALMFDPSGTQTDRYNKQHLVPFGEYVPLREYLWFVRPLVELVGDFTPGVSFKPLQVDRIKAGVLICFESVFPDIARQETVEGANLLVNMTNDAWYGRSSAPHQTWAMAMLRAVENRRSLVRAANTGISGFVDPAGIVKAESFLFEEDVLTEEVALLSEQTVFALGGHWFGDACLALVLPLLCLTSVRRWQLRRSKERHAERKGMLAARLIAASACFARI